MYTSQGIGDSNPCPSIAWLGSASCVAATWDYYFGDPAAKAAATALLYPDTIEPILAPPVPGAPAPDATVSDTTTGDVLAAQMAAWQAQNQATIDQTAANLDAAGNASNLPNPAASIPTWLWAVLIGGGALLVYGAVRR
jgi:hypothetical protein